MSSYYDDADDRQNIIVLSCLGDDVYYSSADTNIKYHTLERPNSPDKFCIMFGFKCEDFVHEWCLDAESGQRVYRGIFLQNIFLLEVLMRASDYLDDAWRYLHDNFLAWPLPENKRWELVNFVLKMAIEGVQSMPESCNTIQINSNFSIVHSHVVANLIHERDLAMTRSMDVAEPNMVSTDESAIESLKGVLVAEGSKVLCTVCMEEMEGGCEAKQLPCSHVFHKDCIEPWLRRSHYCPVCRFELPKTTTATLAATTSLDD